MSCSCPQLPAKPGAVEDVVAQHERGRVAGEELLAEQECLRQALGALLDDVGEVHAELGPVAEEPDEGRLVLRAS